ncbi:MAG: lamin tail domain-containing protein [Candidatus Paceibacterota bacterium]|jgi:P pilus assembly chaperone PapD
MIKKFLILLVLFFSAGFFVINNAEASSEVIINEFVSHPNPGEKEWIELLNTTDNPINLTGWKLTELSTPSTDPVENDINSPVLSGILLANDILVFEINSSKFNDTGDSIGLYNGTTLVYRVTYGTISTVINYSIDLTAPEIGKSGAFISGNWESNQDPSKNDLNPNSNNEGTGNNDGGTGTGTGTTQTNTTVQKTEEVEIPKISAEIVSKAIVVAGIPNDFEATILGYDKEPLRFGKLAWNFGDGGTKELKENEKISYTYNYPGEYVVVLDYTQYYYYPKPDATDRFIIKVVPSEITLSFIDSPTGLAVELNNPSKYEVDLSSWILSSNQKNFTFPKNTIILPGKKITISPQLTGFVSEDKNNLKLIYPNGGFAFTYSGDSGSQNIKPKIVYIKSDTEINPQIKEASALTTDIQPIDQNSDLTASAINSGTEKTSNKNLSNWLFGILGIIIVGSLSVFLLRNKKKDEFEDIKDIKIIE